MMERAERGRGAAAETLLMLQRHELTEGPVQTYSTGLNEGRLLIGYWVYFLKDL